MEKKFFLEFDEMPELVFVSRDGKNEAYMNGELVKGWISLRIYSDMDSPTTHEIEYLTCATKPRGAR